MKVAKLLLAAAIAAPAFFLTSCEKQIDVQANTVDRSATTTLAKPVDATFQVFEGADETGWNLSFFPLGFNCGTGIIQELQGSSWVNVTGELSFSPNGFITYNKAVAPPVGTQYRVMFTPTKGKNGCDINLKRGASAPYSTITP
jgi:hypothetical protein